MRVELDIRRAKRYEVLTDNQLRQGLVYFVKSLISEDTFCGPCVTGDHTNNKEFSEWFKFGRIFVMENGIDNNVISTEPY